ncbi:glycosyltransferase family 4 protein [Actinomyces weissii]|uniref:Glycosyltransferase family 4 protein n=1 Tax=Actinomyces weissii TaxID=675090 RepID=A0A7T7S1J9_9ACTO|nr:glycosyltransferase family 4 protein [Actinomyces weissii]QQM66991.1 glycosyltransferase family 4 protein [Actinomyces weissii]
MRIAFIVNHYPPHVGGVETHVAHLAAQLTALGHQVWVLNLAEVPERRQDGQVTVLTGRASAQVAEIITFPRLGATTVVARFLRAHRIEVVSTHTRFFPMSLLGVRAARRAGVPVIHTEHGSGFVSSTSSLVALGSRTVDLTVGRYVLRHADRVLAVSEESAAFASRLCGVRAEVFHNAITPPVPDSDRPDRTNHLVFVGRVVPGKGWETFLHVVATLRADGHDVDGELLGGGPQLEQAHRLCADLGLANVVDVRGRVGEAEVRASLAGATLVNPTVLSEGFQTTLLEALAEGGRVVTYPVPGAEVLREQGAPVEVCPQRDQNSLVDALRAALTTPGRAWGPAAIAPWTWPERARQYEAIAQQVLSGARGTAGPAGTGRSRT